MGDAGIHEACKGPRRTLEPALHWREKMIDLYDYPTPNAWKVSIMLEECGLPYTLKHVDILNDEQFEPEFLKISPNNKIPAIVDHDAPWGGSQSVFESGAILVYLA